MRRNCLHFSICASGSGIHFRYSKPDRILSLRGRRTPGGLQRGSVQVEMALGCSGCRNSSVGRGSTPGNPLALTDGQNRGNFTKERGNPPSQNAVSAGTTHAKMLYWSRWRWTQVQWRQLCFLRIRITMRGTYNVQWHHNTMKMRTIQRLSHTPAKTDGETQKSQTKNACCSGREGETHRPQKCCIDLTDGIVDGTGILFWNEECILPNFAFSMMGRCDGMWYHISENQYNGDCLDPHNKEIGATFPREGCML